MEHVAIDLGGRESQICVRSAEGAIVQERRCATGSLRSYLASRQPSRVIVEACAEAFRVADHAREHGHEVVVVPATLAPALGVGSRGLKNDVRDARHLSAASCRMAQLPAVHIASESSRGIKSTCSMREGLVGARTALINTVRGWLRAMALGPMRSGAVETFPARLQRHLASHRIETPAFVERNVRVIEVLTEEIAQADAELEELVTGHEVCRRLMTVPGVGAVTAARFVAAIDDVSRFEDAHKLESYLGLTPGERSSSDHRRITSITKAGSTRVRWTLVQAAWAAMRSRGRHAMLEWTRKVSDRRGRRVAVLALARKMAGILYRIWRDGTEYDPSKGALMTS
jgi:transposase